MSTPATADLTIEQLAVEVGMSVRNIRNHQTRGLLQPPDVRARVGYYNAEHVARLRLIRDLQDDGFNLGAIERLIKRSAGLTARMPELREAIGAYELEEPEVVTLAELTTRLGGARDPADLQRAIDMLLVLPRADGRYEIRSPALIRSGGHAAAAGIPVSAMLELVDAITSDCDAISEQLAQLFLQNVWEPFAAAGQPDEDWDEFIASLHALQPVAFEVMLAVFKQRFARTVERHFGEVLEEHSRRSR
jgi:DNA-binding transcriptional MerR regulator